MKHKKTHLNNEAFTTFMARVNDYYNRLMSGKIWTDPSDFTKRGSEKTFSSYCARYIIENGQDPNKFFDCTTDEEAKNACEMLNQLNIHLHSTRQVGPNTAYGYIHALYCMLVSEYVQQGLTLHPRLEATFVHIKKDAKQAAATRDHDKYDPAATDKELDDVNAAFESDYVVNKLREMETGPISQEGLEVIMLYLSKENWSRTGAIANMTVLEFKNRKMVEVEIELEGKPVKVRKLGVAVKKHKTANAHGPMYVFIDDKRYECLILKYMNEFRQSTEKGADELFLQPNGDPYNATILLPKYNRILKKCNLKSNITSNKIRRAMNSRVREFGTPEDIEASV